MSSHYFLLGTVLVRIKLNKGLEYFLEISKLTQDMKLELSKAVEVKSQAVVKSVKKLKDIENALYRCGLDVDEGLIFFIHLANSAYLEKPILTISQKDCVLEFAKYNHTYTHPPEFKGVFNYSNRGFINTLDSNFLVTDLVPEMKGIQASTLGLSHQTFTPVDAAKIKIYKHFNFPVNGKSIALWLIDEESETKTAINKAMLAIFKPGYLSDAKQSILDSEDAHPDSIDGYSRQILMPRSDGSYCSISPIFNHHTLSFMSKLKFIEAKVATFNEKNLGGTQPGNISSTVHLYGGVLALFVMGFPKPSSAQSNALFNFATKGLLNLYEFKDSLTTYKQTYLNSEVPNQVKRKMESRFASRITQFFFSRLDGLLSEHEGYPLNESFKRYYGLNEGLLQGSSMNRVERFAFISNLIFHAFRQKDFSKEALTPEIVKAIETEVMKNV